MLGIFKKNIGLQCVFVFTMALLLWGGSFINPTPMEVPKSYAFLYDLIYQTLHDTPLVSTIIAFVLVIIESVWLNLMLFNHKIQTQVNLLPAALYILLMSIVPGGQTITPTLLVNIAILAATNQLLQNKNLAIPLDKNFTCAFFIGLAILCHWESIWLIIPLLIIYPMMKLYTWNNWVILVLGIIAPFILLLGYQFMWGDISYHIYLITNEFQLPSISYRFSDRWMLITSLVFLLLLAISWINFNQYYNKQTQLKKNNANIILLPIITSFIWCIYHELIPINTQFFAISGAYLFCLFFSQKSRRQWIPETLFLLFTIVGTINIYSH